MAAFSRTPSSLLSPRPGLPTSQWGSGQEALLEAQHLVKGPQEPEFAGLWFLGVGVGVGVGRGPVGSGPSGRGGEAMVEEKHQSPQLGPGEFS